MMMSTMIQLPVIFMSLPTSLIHCILSDLLDVLSLIRLDFAFCGDAVFHSQLLGILKSDLFYVKKFESPDNLPSWRIPPSEHPYTYMLEWIVRRHIKVIHIEPHALCSHAVLEEFLQKYGEHVRHIRSNNDYRRRENSPTQGALIEKYCRNLEAYIVDGYAAYDECILRVLNNNSRLKRFYIYCSLIRDIDPINNHVATLHHLQQLQWDGDDYEFGESLVALLQAAPNLQKLSLSCDVEPHNEVDSELVVDVARACPNLRTLSCNELHFGPNDSSLRPFLATCSGIVNLDLSMHYELTDTVLIEALSELHSLQCLNLRGCSRLTDRTLQFLTQCFAATLQVLYLDHSEHYIWDEANEDVEPVALEVISSAFTTGGIASLRAQCTKLHTFHYSVEVWNVQFEGHVPVSPPLIAYQSATIVHMCTGYEAFLLMVLEHCQQMQILTINYARYYESRVWLSADHLMAIAARCPQLHTVVSKKYISDEDDVDFSAVKKAFPMLLFTKDKSVVEFDVLELPV